MKAMSNSPSVATTTINRADHVLLTGPGGSVTGGKTGFFARDTRFVSQHVLTLGGQPLEVRRDATVRFYSARHVLANPDLGTGADRIPAGSLVLTVERSVDGAVHEDLDLENLASAPARVDVGVLIDGDFADMFEVRGVLPPIPRRPTATWSPGRGELQIEYRREDFARRLVIRCEQSGSTPEWRDGQIVFDATIPAHGTWHTCLVWIPVMDPDAATPADVATSVPACHAVAGFPPEAGGVPRGAMSLRTPEGSVQAAWDQAAWDLESMRIPAEEAGGLPVPAAGIPWYLALFGRDSLITALQAMPGYPELARGTLTALASLQGDRNDPVRDMEPGKILHEIRHGEVAQRSLLPFQPYFGTHDATPLFPVLLARTYAWTGDRALVERLLPAAEAAVGWVEHDGDRDGDGFLEYATRSPHGFPNQGWKDATDAIPREDGSLASLPIALCEHQAYAYQARLSLAGLYDLLGREADAGRLRSDAARLRDRFNEAFWWEAEGTYYLGLDGEKRPIRSVASNAGHCLATGIVPPDRASLVADRLLADDMWSGWGIRTLASTHRAFDPLSYHTGSVWPHDNAMIATGLAAIGRRSQVGTHCPGSLRRCGPAPQPSAPRALLGRRPCRWPGAGPLSGLLRAPGMGRQRAHRAAQAPVWARPPSGSRRWGAYPPGPRPARVAAVPAPRPRARLGRRAGRGDHGPHSHRDGQLDGPSHRARPGRQISSISPLPERTGVWYPPR